MKHALIVIASVLLLVPTAKMSYSNEFADSVGVNLTVAEADSLLDLVDDQALQIDTLTIDLRLAHWQNKEDSLFYARMLQLQEQQYEQIIAVYKEDRGNIIVRFLKQPALWFVVGAYAGLQAAR
jgi:hypothetical protein